MLSARYVESSVAAASISPEYLTNPDATNHQHYTNPHTPPSPRHHPTTHATNLLPRAIPSFAAQGHPILCCPGPSHTKRSQSRALQHVAQLGGARHQLWQHMEWHATLVIISDMWGYSAQLGGARSERRNRIILVEQRVQVVEPVEQSDPSI